MIYADPIEEGWATGLYYDALAVPYYLSADKVESDYSTVRFARELGLFQRFCTSGRLLDVGCSTGAFLYRLQTSFPGDYQPLGMDVAGPALDYAEKKGVPVLRQSFLEHDFGGRNFAAVTFWAVLEHLLNPRDFLLKAASILQPGGFCFILVPNFRSLATRVLGARYRYIFPQHINYFTPSSLRRFAGAAADLRVVHSYSTHLNPIVIWQDFKSHGEFVPDADRAKLLKRTTRYKQRAALKPVKGALTVLEKTLGWLNLADNIVLVLQRKAP
jgi:2-polyprenyl-3-methyl-5-hydroxy-6-metoxy-1,4-benzoquinol methylase